MNTNPVRILRAVAVCMFGSALLASTALAQIVSHSRDVVIEQPINLPEQAQLPGDALYLNTESGDGSAYLYVEQQHGQRLVVFDVTDLTRVKMVRTEELAMPGPFEFAEDVNGSFIVLRSLDNQEMAILNVHKAKAPVLQTMDSFRHAGRVASIGRSTFLLTDARFSLKHERVPEDYTVVDVNKKSNPSVLYTAKLVRASITREETGTIFLLGEDGLAIIRHPEVEQEYEASQRATN